MEKHSSELLRSLWRHSHNTVVCLEKSKFSRQSLLMSDPSQQLIIKKSYPALFKHFFRSSCTQVVNPSSTKHDNKSFKRNISYTTICRKPQIYKLFSPAWNCVSRRATTSGGGKFKFVNLALCGLMYILISSVKWCVKSRRWSCRFDKIGQTSGPSRQWDSSPAPGRCWAGMVWPGLVLSHTVGTIEHPAPLCRSVTYIIIEYRHT